MKVQFSPYFKYAGVLVCSALLLFACSKDDGPGNKPDPVDPINPTEDAQLILTASKTELSEGDEVTFSVTANGKDVDADIYVDDTKITGNTHRFDKMGIYEVYAQKEDYTQSKTETIKVYQTDVYVSGAEYIGQNRAKYWKNGVSVEITDGSTDAVGMSIFVNNDDVYLAGFQLVTGNYYAGRYWKNGNAVTLNENNKDAHLSSIVVIGEDVYVAGNEKKIKIFFFLPNIGKME
jgi:hypothetical protein